MTTPQHKYVAVLGSCCTGDAIGATDFKTVATARLRLLLYQGRTTFFSMLGCGLLPQEFECTPAGLNAPKLEWGFRMTIDEAHKNHYRRLEEVIGLSDALIIDHVSAFMFPSLVDRSQGRYFLKSWEWERYILPRIDLQQVWLWELPMETSIGAVRQVLGGMYEKQPKLTVIFHQPVPCFNDNVGFADPAITTHVDYYRQYCDRIYDEACRCFPRVRAVSPPSPRADPLHASGAHPFRFEKKYLELIRQQIECILGV